MKAQGLTMQPGGQRRMGSFEQLRTKVKGQGIEQARSLGGRACLNDRIKTASFPKGILRADLPTQLRQTASNRIKAIVGAKYDPRELMPPHCDALAQDLLNAQTSHAADAEDGSLRHAEGS